MSDPGDGARQTETVRFWEERYQAKEQIWSGRVNPVLARIVEPLPPGRALDLGCGEGGDAVWLAERGWNVTAVDVSPTALQRGAARAEQLGVAARIAFEQHDLATDFPDGAFDLVSAQFLQTPLDFPKEQVLRAAAAHVSPGGLLLIVEHGAMPPWTRISPDAGSRDAHDHDHGSDHGHDHGSAEAHAHPAVFPTPEELLASLALDPAHWTIEELGAPSRDAVGPNGEAAVLIDNVVAARRGL